MNRLPQITVAALFAAAAFAQAQESRTDAIFRAKYGRPTPATEARQEAEKASTAYRDAKATKPSGTADAWAEQRHRAKFGRSTPAEESRIEAEKGSTAYRDATPAAAPQKDRWFENFYQRKYGRPAPNTSK